MIYYKSRSFCQPILQKQDFIWRIHMSIEKMSILKKTLYPLCAAAIMVTLTIAICALTLNKIIAPMLVNAGNQLAMVNWGSIGEFFWISMIGIIICSIAACMVGKSFRKTEKDNNSPPEKKERVDKNWPGTQP